MDSGPAPKGRIRNDGGCGVRPSGTSPTMTEDSGSMQPHLFVYGTLMRGFDHPMAKLLSASAEFCGDAHCQGRLYLVKHYPGLVLSDDASDVVFGELFSLRMPDATFA